MRKSLFLLSVLLSAKLLSAQSPASYTSADIYLQIKKLNVLGSVLYVAAHPDDENTRLIAWLSKERLVRTGYLSLTRGDGGQNLIGDEQGVDLGLIRTQELLSARRIDGGEQFFSRAYDFGFTKTTEEAFRFWDKKKILSDVVWIIRQFQPDVIITRFPEDSRAGHGHHSGSAVLAHEAFRAAADSTQFPEQFKYGVRPWQAKRILWNTFNFGNTNTTSDDQYKVDVGGFNPVLGKSYGEIAAESRSQHKSQGFGVPASRGVALEYFTQIEGMPVKNDLLDDVEITWKRLPGGEKISSIVDSLLSSFSLVHPENSVKGLVRLYAAINALPEHPWKKKKLNEVQQLIEECSGLWMEASSNSEYAVMGDTVKVTYYLNNRLGVPATLSSITLDGKDSLMNKPLEKNRPFSYVQSFIVSNNKPISQPYWMVQKMSEGSFNVDTQLVIGKPQNDPSYSVTYSLDIEGTRFVYTKPVAYKFTDPVKGELYEPLVVVPALSISTDPSIVVFKKEEEKQADVNIKLTANRHFAGYQANITERLGSTSQTQKDSSFTVLKGLSREYGFTIDNKLMKDKTQDFVHAFTLVKKDNEELNPFLSITSIKYDHIPHIHYFYQDVAKVLNIDLKTSGKKVGYIEGAGDKVPLVLRQMGYEVTILKEKDIFPANLKQFDAILTGVRAYNVNDFMAEKYDILMNYVKDGGNLVVQYNTSNFISSVKAKIGPYPFTISRNRVTDEKSPVKFLLPQHPVLNFPNKITQSDFDGWVQERSIYNAELMDPSFEMPIAMADPAENDQNGSLIIANYGRGKFVYTGLVFFRELPAGVPGAYRLLANIIALNRKKAF